MRSLTEHAKDRSPGRTKYVLPRLGAYVLRYWPLFVLAILLTLGSNQLSLMGPRFSGQAIDAISAEGGVQFAVVRDRVVRMLTCYLGSAALSYLLSVLMVHLSQNIVRSMRRDLFEHLTVLPVGFFDANATGDIVSRLSYDIDTINTSLSHDVVHVMASLYTVVGSLVFMWRISKPMIAIFAVTVPASILFARFRSRLVRPLFRRRSRMYGELNGYAEEMLSGCRTIRAYRQEGEIGRRFAGRNTDTMDAYYKAEHFGAMLYPGMTFITNVSIAMITVVGGILYMYSRNGTVAAGSALFITLGGVAQFVQYSRRFANPINEFANVLHEMQSALSAAERVFRVIDEPAEPADAPDAAVLSDPAGEVELDRVTFAYTPEATILHDVTIHAPAGKTVAIVGPTGAGKTTIINLLMRFYDATEGTIRVDGQEVHALTRDSLRRAYTMVLQDTWLFQGTIRENIAYGREDASPEEVYAAAKAARIHDYIQRLPDGYDTVLTDGGVNLSKGQRQLITIARAMLADAPMLILDEATSNVDSRTEQQIQQAMAELMRGRTAFVIAHRLSTVKDADCILVLQNGRLTERGTHGELLALGGFYASLYNAQFT